MVCDDVDLVRLHHCRRRMTKQESIVVQDIAATRIQAFAHSIAARKRFQQMLDEHFTAARLQSLQRMRLQRKKYIVIRDRNRAAKPVQALARGVKARKEFRQMKLERESATKYVAFEVLSLPHVIYQNISMPTSVDCGRSVGNCFCSSLLCCCRIQGQFRMRRSRRELRSRTERRKAAITIQKQLRVRAARQRAVEARLRLRAIGLIQRVVRARKEFRAYKKKRVVYAVGSRDVFLAKGAVHSGLRFRFGTNRIE